MKWLKEWLKRSAFIVKVYECIALKVKAVKHKFIMIFINRPKAKHSYGEKNKDKTFFLIPASYKSGLYSNALLVLPVMQYAIRRGYVPVLDFKTTFVAMMQDSDKKGLENAWEYYYEQPGKVSIEEVFQSKKVIHYSKEAYDIKRPSYFTKFPAPYRELLYWNKFIAENLHLQKSIAEHIEQTAAKLFAGKKKILGVGMRAFFRALYCSKEFSIEGHPAVPDCEEMIQIIETKMKEWGSEYIFLSVDDREYQQNIVNYFGDKCLFIERHLHHLFVNNIPLPLHDSKYWDQIHCELQGVPTREYTEEYITEVYLLSRCDSLYSCRNGGSIFACLLNGGKYEHVEMYDEGEYHL